jgi:hypothetical protein
LLAARKAIESCDRTAPIEWKFERDRVTNTALFIQLGEHVDDLLCDGQALGAEVCAASAD